MADVVAHRAALLSHYQPSNHSLVVHPCADDSACHAQQQHGEKNMNILLAVDDSPNSASAIESVAARSWPSDTTVRVLSAVPILIEPDTSIRPDEENPLPQTMKEMTRKAEDLASQAADSLRAKGLSAEPVVREGDASSAIVEEARQWPADLIVVGAGERSDPEGKPSSRLARSVQAYAPCPVEAVRAES